MRLNAAQRLLLLASCCWFFGEGLLGPLFAVYAEKVGGDLLDITGAWATFLITSGVLYIVFGKLMDAEFTVTNKPAFYIALTSMMIGMQLFLAGFVAELVNRNASERNTYLIEDKIGW